MTAFTTRPGEPSDAGAIVGFQLAMARETEAIELDLARCEAGVAAVFSDPSLGRYFVAESDGKLAGVLMITYEWSDWRARTVWWIQSVYVDPKWRRQGVYAALYQTVKELALADPNVAGIRLYVDKRNAPAQQVYTRLGMNGDHYTTFEWMKD